MGIYAFKIWVVFAGNIFWYISVNYVLSVYLTAFELQKFCCEFLTQPSQNRFIWLRGKSNLSNSPLLTFCVYLKSSMSSVLGFVGHLWKECVIKEEC